MRVSLDLPFIKSDEPSHVELLECILACHQEAARENQNASSFVAGVTFGASGRFEQAIASAVLTVGNVHAPILLARMTLRHATDQMIVETIEAGLRVPGWGNSFFKDCVDPAFLPAYELLQVLAPALRERIDQITAKLHEYGKEVYPNAAVITAAACELLGIPDGIETAIFAVARIPVWAKAAKS